MREELTEPNLPDPGPPPPPSSAPAFPPSAAQEPGLSPSPTLDPFPRPFPSDDLNDRAHTFERGYYISWDRSSWWNGISWVPGLPPGSGTPAPASDAPLDVVQLVVGLGGLIVMGAIAFSFCQGMSGMGTLTP